MNIRLTIITVLAVSSALWAMLGTTHGQGQIYVVNQFSNGTIGEYDATTGATINASLVSGLNYPYSIALSGGNLLVTDTYRTNISEYDTTTGALLNYSLVSVVNPRGILVSGGNLFIASYNGFIGEYDATTGAEINASLVSGLGYGQQGGLALSGGNLFVSNFNNPNVGEYDAVTGATINASLVPANISGPIGLEVYGGKLYVANFYYGTIGEFDATTGAEINASFISGLNRPYGIAIAGGMLYVANFGDGNPSVGTGFIGEYDATTGATINASLVSGIIRPTFLVVVPPPNTPVGLNVEVNAGLVGSTMISLTFPQVTASGTTMATPIDPSSAGTLPSAFELTGSNLAFDITTTATYTTPIIVGFQVSSSLDVSTLAVLHSECGFAGNSCTQACTGGCTLQNRTLTYQCDAQNNCYWIDSTGTQHSPGQGGYPVSPAPNTVYASVNSLSPFLIAKFKFKAQIQQPINSDGSSVFSVKRGVVPVVFTLASDGTPTCQLPPATISVFRTAGGAVGSVDESTYLTKADSGPNFRIDTTKCQYVYNLAASSLGTGTYRVNISIGGTVVGSGTFALK
jgi:hypothetical protein